MLFNVLVAMTMQDLPVCLKQTFHGMANYI